MLLAWNFVRKQVQNESMPATYPLMIQREIGDDRVCLLTFDRPESGANIFDAATLKNSTSTSMLSRKIRRFAA